MDWLVESINPSHRLKDFSCGERDLDRWLKNFADDNNRRRIGRVRVAVRPGTWDVLGFYCLSSFSVEPKHVPAAEPGRLPKYPLPCILLGQLATHTSVQGQGLGEHLLTHAIHSCLRATQEVAAYALVVHALHERAKSFYLKYGFTPFEEEPMHLFLHMQKIGRLFAGEEASFTSSTAARTATPASPPDDATR